MIRELITLYIYYQLVETRENTGIMVGNGWYGVLPMRMGRFNLRDALTLGRLV